ncbi:hypothetical protein BC827DRAFT_158919 [Russula dissimulans]|nr:hypothetical protein BC827DRAFT_158919 [Russula dissimulans]
MLQALPRGTRLVWELRSTHARHRPFPRLTRQFASHPHSQASSPDESATEREKWSRIVHGTHLLLEQGKNVKAIQFFKRSVSVIPSVDRPSLPVLYERGISEFLDRKRFRYALELYHDMMAEGWFASGGLRARMLVCSSIVKAPHKQQELASLLDKLSNILSLPTYSEGDLCQLLTVMKSHPLVDSQFVNQLVDGYVNSRGSEYELELNTVTKLIQFHAHVGCIDDAERLVYSQQGGSHTRSGPVNPVLITTLISEHIKRSSLSSEGVNSLLEKMQQSHTQVDLPLMNVLVRSAVRRRNLPLAFTLYEMIRGADPSHMIPDSFTFGTLFNALQNVWVLRNRFLRAVRQPANAPTPRQLFRQMLECDMLRLAIQEDDRGKHPVVGVATLNVALRVFLLNMDYPAAFVALRTFPKFDLKPDLRTYRFVLTILLAHLKHRLQAAHKGHVRHALWVNEFLGSHGRAAVAAAAADAREDIDVGPEIARALLEFAVAVPGKDYRTPPHAVILGHREARAYESKAEWDVEPLERLMAKAILAATTASSERPTSVGQTERRLREHLAPYFFEMIPDGMWIGRRLRRSAG